MNDVARTNRRRFFIVTVVGIVALSVVAALVVGAVINRFRSEADARDEQICLSQAAGRKAVRTAIADAVLASGEALISVADATPETIAKYREELTTRLTAQLEVDLPGIVCTAEGPEPAPPDAVT